MVMRHYATSISAANTYAEAALLATQIVRPAAAVPPN